MLFRKSPEKFWDLISSKYAASPILDLAAYKTKIEKIKSYLSPENVLLDIGCGTGTQCNDPSGYVKQATGIDISGKLLAIAEQRKAERNIDNVEFIKTSLFDERFRAGSFDVVMAFYVLHFFEDIDAVFKRIHTLLKPGSLFISETTCMGEHDITEGKILGFFGWLGFMPKINPLTYKQLEQAMETAGFDLIEKTQFSDSKSEFTLIMKKR
jgi:ubiquinone/menaquinone biosynthesis C-methylase UbiE